MARTRAIDGCWHFDTIFVIVGSGFWGCRDVEHEWDAVDDGFWELSDLRVYVMRILQRVSTNANKEEIPEQL